MRKVPLSPTTMEGVHHRVSFVLPSFSSLSIAVHGPHSATTSRHHILPPHPATTSRHHHVPPPRSAIFSPLDFFLFTKDPKNIVGFSVLAHKSNSCFHFDSPCRRIQARRNIYRSGLTGRRKEYDDFVRFHFYSVGFFSWTNLHGYISVFTDQVNDGQVWRAH